MFNKLLFLLTVLISNIIQGITGFAGTVLAMPFSVMLVGFDTARPLLNILGILSGIYILATSYRYVDLRRLGTVFAVMLPGMALGFYFKGLLAGRTGMMYIVLGSVVLAVGLAGLARSFAAKKRGGERPLNKYLSGSLLAVSGVIHGMFVCGGPFLVAYLADRCSDKNEFRSTISAVWLALNTIIFIDDLRHGLITGQRALLLIPTAAALFAGMFIGGLLFKKIGRELFMKLTFALLTVSGAALILH